MSVVPFLMAAMLGYDNGEARTPPMGWNSWNPIRCEGLNEKAIFEIADAIVASGLRDVGYSYVNIDDCWMAPQRAAASAAVPPAAEAAYEHDAQSEDTVDVAALLVAPRPAGRSPEARAEEV